MPITAECPQCGFKGNVPDKFQGKKVKCRQCANFFRVGGEVPAASANGTGGVRKSDEESAMDLELIEDVAPSPPVKTKPSAQGISKTRPSAQGTKRASSAEFKLDDAPRKKQASSAELNLDGPRKKQASSAEFNLDGPRKKQAPLRGFKKKGKEPASPAVIAVGVLAMILGGAALAVGNQGLVGLISVPLSGLGMLLGVGGVVMAWGKPGLRILTPVGGSLVCLVALPIAGWYTYQLIDSGALSSKKDSGSESAGSDPAVPGTPGGATRATTPGHTGPGTQPPNTTRDTKPDTRSTKIDTTPTEEYVDALRGAKAQAGVVKVQVTAVEQDAKAKRLLIRLLLENTAADQNVDYDDGWGTTPLKDGVPEPTLVDNTNTRYKLQVMEQGQITGQIVAQTLQPQKSYPDILVFDLPPADKVLYLHLELPASSMGIDGKKLSGKFKFKIVKAMLLGKGPPLEKPPDKPKKELPADLPKFLVDRKAKLLKGGPLDKKGALNDLADIGAAALPDAPEVAQMLANKGIDVNLQAAAAETLGAMGPAAKSYIPVLKQGLKHEFFLVQAKCAWALGQMGAEAKDALPDLEKLLTSKEEGVPAEAKKAIARIKAGK